MTENAVTQPSGPIDRPLRLGEVFAEAARIYALRIWATAVLGAVAAGAFLVAHLDDLVWFGVVALLLTVGWAVATRLVAGDDAPQAWLQVGRRAPALLVLTLVTTFPFALAIQELIAAFAAVLWLAVVGFAIPVTVVEESDGRRRIPTAFRRSFQLARAEYLHAAGVIAALVMTEVLLLLFVFGALRGLAENGSVAAFALAVGATMPFFFFGLAVLYFDQRARAISSP